MATSLKKVCSALGKTGSVSLCRDIFGFAGSRLGTTDARTGVPPRVNATRPVPTISINQFVRLLRGKHFHVRLIPAGSDLLTDNDRDVIDYAVFRLREIYSAAGIGIGLVTQEDRTAANSAGHAVVRSDSDIDKTGHDIFADGNFVPVAIPADMNVTVTNPDHSVTITLGRSPVKGPCSPRKESGMNSAVVDFSGEEGGRTLAHEVGHFLGAEHPSSNAGTNLMIQTGSVSGDPFLATTIIASDKTKMLNHCTINPGLSV
jgi:Metallo-peptidase family M12B Reprolysin-like